MIAEFFKNFDQNSSRKNNRKTNDDKKSNDMKITMLLGYFYLEKGFRTYLLSK